MVRRRFDQLHVDVAGTLVEIAWDDAIGCSRRSTRGRIRYARREVQRGRGEQAGRARLRRTGTPARTARVLGARTDGRARASARRAGPSAPADSWLIITPMNSGSPRGLSLDEAFALHASGASRRLTSKSADGWTIWLTDTAEVDCPGFRTGFCSASRSLTGPSREARSKAYEIVDAVESYAQALTDAELDEDSCQGECEARLPLYSGSGPEETSEPADVLGAGRRSDRRAGIGSVR